LLCSYGEIGSKSNRTTWLCVACVLRE